MARVSHYIRRRTAANFHHAIRLAEALKLPLNVFVTVNFSMSECPTEEVSAAFARLRNTRYSHWARRPGSRSKATPYQPTFVWVIEAGGGVTAAHWLLHVPPERRAVFEKKLGKWVEAVAGATFSSTINVKAAPTPRAAGRYMLKGMDPVSAAMFGIDHEHQGAVHGRRCGYSLNIGPSVKRKLRAAGQYQKARTWRPSSAGAMPVEVRPS